jgi:light-regulated signal transduction histidine kinase (bacteriophytochrome)
LLSSSNLESYSPLVSTTEIFEGSPSSGKRYVTNTFSYLPPDNANSLTTPVDGQKIYRCEDELIHIPGAIQHFGALIAIREEAGVFLVRVVSENSESVTGLKPDALFELRCFTDLLTLKVRKEFLIRVHALPADGLKSSGSNPDVFAISLTSLKGAPISLYCAMHLEPESHLIICEFELEKDIIKSTSRPDNSVPHEPIRILDHQATEPERLLSTTRKSKPLHTLEVARASSRPLVLLDLFQIQFEIQTQLSTLPNLSALLDVVVGLVHDLTGFHRVMVYRFDEAAAGIISHPLLKSAKAGVDQLIMIRTMIFMPPSIVGASLTVSYRLRGE